MATIMPEIEMEMETVMAVEAEMGIKMRPKRKQVADKGWC